jgi:GH3 auxin-responsive promoter
MIPALANSLWLSACLPEYRRFHRAVLRVADEQTGLLRSMLRANADTEFGRMHGFRSIHSVEDYQKQVPVRDYDGHEDWIARIAGGAKNVLTSDPVRLFEPTSGSTSASKLVPYTATLQRQFRRAIQAWIANLFFANPNLLTGRAYWSVSPAATRARRTEGGIPIGFDDDAAYLGGWQQRLVESLMAVPSVLSRCSDPETFRYLTLLFLLRCRRLKLVSVWNPTFLSILMDCLPQWGDELAHDLEHGTISRQSEIPLYLPPPRRDPQRARELRAALRSNTAAERHAQLWPELRIISCWTDANAASPARILQSQFPQSQIQGKGLLATEAAISFPLCGETGSALAVRSHFFEFLPVASPGEAGPPCLAHELKQGGRYAVVVTTGGGLYRYKLGDVVEVAGNLHQCPLIRFVGRQQHISDWFGEKLNEAHVAKVLQEAFDEYSISPSFAMLACDTRLTTAADTHPAAGYVLYIEADAPNAVLRRAARSIDEALCGNFHYGYARHLGQLAPVTVFRATNAAASYLANAIQRGQRAGDVKPLALDPRDIWSKVFSGYPVSTTQSISDQPPAASKSAVPN